MEKKETEPISEEKFKLMIMVKLVGPSEFSVTVATRNVKAMSVTRRALRSILSMSASVMKIYAMGLTVFSLLQFELKLYLYLRESCNIIGLGSKR